MIDKVITIGRQFGSGGHEVGARLAKKLGIPFYDAQLLKLTAENSRFAESFLEKVDEKKPAFLSVGASVMSGSGDAVMNQFLNLSANDQVFVETGKTMHMLAEKGPCVIVGRCADYVLRDVGSINVFISADIKDRVSRKMALEGEKISAEEMEKRILTTDKKRAKYYEYYSHEKWGDSSHYNLCINTSSVGVDGAVQLIEMYIEEYKKKDILPDKY